MRPCVVLPCFFSDGSFEDHVRTIARLGYDACEIYDWRSLNFESAVRALSDSGRFSEEEREGAKEVLSAAAMTYVAALAVTLAQILRLLLIVASASGRRRD